MTQIIIVMETRKSCNSDYKYISTTIKYFYKEGTFLIKPIYAKTKSELINQNSKNRSAINSYAAKSVVLICADYDRDDDPLNPKLLHYCTTNNFEIIYMNRNIEEVFLNVLNVKNKTDLANSFLRKAKIILKNLSNLNESNPVLTTPSSNLLFVLDKYLKRK